MWLGDIKMHTACFTMANQCLTFSYVFYWRNGVAFCRESSVHVLKDEQRRNDTNKMQIYSSAVVKKKNVMLC